EITFSKWIIFGLPISILLLFICWKYLTNFAFNFQQKSFPGGKAEIKKQLNAIGKITYEEKWVLTIFAATAFAWITRSFLLTKIFPDIDDTIIAVTAGVLLFLIPAAKNKKRALLTWEEA